MFAGCGSSRKFASQFAGDAGAGADEAGACAAGAAVTITHASTTASTFERRVMASILVALVFVGDALDLLGRRLAVGRFVVAGVVPRSLAFPLERLIAIVRRADAPPLCFALAGNRNDRLLFAILVSHVA